MSEKEGTVIKTRYKMCERYEAKMLFESFFDEPISKYADDLLSILSGHVTIDIIKFDGWLHKRFGQYEDDNKSMREIITEKFGKRASDFIESLI